MSIWFMLSLFLGITGLLLPFIFSRNIKAWIGSGVLITVSILLLLWSTAIFVKDNQGGLVIKKFGSSLTDGHIIASNGEKGPQARILAPGWHFGYWPWLYNLESIDNIDIPEGKIGIVLAKDGASLKSGEVFAQEWGNPLEMIDAEKFMQTGTRGPQLTVLSPGQYRYNNRLFDIQTRDALTVKIGEVAVIKANAGKEYTESTETVNGVPLVPKGYRGIWSTALIPNTYYIHPVAYEAIRIRTTNRIYNYTSSIENVSNTSQARDHSIIVRTKDAFEFPVDIRVSAKVSAEDAPFLVAKLGNVDADTNKDGFDTLEEIVILPSVRAIFRNTAENHSAIEYISTRSNIEKAATELFKKELDTYQVESDGIFIADIGLSKTDAGKELLQTQTDQEVASQEKAMWKEKTLAQDARAESVRAEAKADKEKDIVKSEADIEIAKNKAMAMIEEAKGKSQAAEQEIAAFGGIDGYIKSKAIEKIAEKWSGNLPWFVQAKVDPSLAN